MATTVKISDVITAIANARYRAQSTQGNLWYYVRILPDGEIISGNEGGPCWPMDECRGEGKHPVTVWEMQQYGMPVDEDVEYQEYREDIDGVLERLEAVTWLELV